MLWAIHCTDVPNSGPLREQFMEGHKQFIAANKPKIFYSGSMRSDDSKDTFGSLFIIKADSLEEAKGFLKDEGFNKAGVFEAVVIRRMRKGRFNPALSDLDGKTILYAIHLNDKPGAGKLRETHFEGHRDYINANIDKLFFTGPLQSADGKDNVGSLWIIKADTREEAEAFVKGEALYRAGVFETAVARRMMGRNLNPELADG